MDDLTNDQPVDDNALFAELTGGEVAPATPKTEAAPAPATTTTTEAAPAATTEPARTEPATVPSARLREEADARRNAERERDDLRTKLAALEKPPAKVEPKDIFQDPKGFTDEVVSAALNPVQEQLRNVVFNYSNKGAVAEFGADAVGAAEAALKAAIEGGQVNPDNVRKQLTASLDPVGDVVRWHKQQAAMTRVGNDPDAFLKTELEKLIKDPANAPDWAKAILQQQNQAGGEGGGKPAPVVELPGRPAPTSMPSLRNVGTSAAPAAAASEPSDNELFASTTSRRR